MPPKRSVFEPQSNFHTTELRVWRTYNYLNKIIPSILTVNVEKLADMQTKRWSRSFSTGGRSIQLGRHYDPEFEHGSDEHQAAEPAKKWSVWKAIWRKFLKEKKRRKSRFELSRSVHVPRYDEYSYSQNFDKGSDWDEPDQLLRSFSLRFAHPRSRKTMVLKTNLINSQSRAV
ncbi:unnamed protein product [Cuscuta epithymum]|uniref:Uncharacterized protein n=1 Tax=Cuscuta epithymum TaxID=186058 RepID=A0AAV0F777_9ASTE|nr:unnamed protein product [Cuscuta epithymum]